MNVSPDNQPGAPSRAGPAVPCGRVVGPAGARLWGAPWRFLSLRTAPASPAAPLPPSRSTREGAPPPGTSATSAVSVSHVVNSVTNVFPPVSVLLITCGRSHLQAGAQPPPEWGPQLGVLTPGLLALEPLSSPQPGAQRAAGPGSHVHVPLGRRCGRPQLSGCACLKGIVAPCSPLRRTFHAGEIQPHSRTRPRALQDSSGAAGTGGCRAQDPPRPRPRRAVTG